MYGAGLRFAPYGSRISHFVLVFTNLRQINPIAPLPGALVEHTLLKYAMITLNGANRGQIIVVTGDQPVSYTHLDVYKRQA